MRVLEFARDAVPCTVNNINAQLQIYLDDGAGIEAATFFAHEMGLSPTDVPVDVVSTPVCVGSDAVRIATVQPADSTG
jgi:hypothetical protein